MTSPIAVNGLENSILFEYPVQENIRGYLRLESLFKLFQRNVSSSNKDNHFHALKVLFEILDILERGDTRSELIKELTRLLHHFQMLEANPDVDTSKLANFLKQIKQLHHWINSHQGKFGETTRRLPFIETVKYRTNMPGGSCQFDCPDLYLFLNKPTDVRKNLLNELIEDIKGVETSVKVILRLIRDSGQWQDEKSPLGSFILQTAKQSVKLLRIKHVNLDNAFPEFSCGKHRSSIHFMTFNTQHKKIPVNTEVMFKLACCE